MNMISRHYRKFQIKANNLQLVVELFFRAKNRKLMKSYGEVIFRDIKTIKTFGKRR
ncbi:hypothetical protein KHA80_02915 [Anaerobacillus sp. HL2]|nr:hypothetical protein KHA80_02915 [Anaerobacillus sp. HL2]